MKHQQTSSRFDQSLLPQPQVESEENLINIRDLKKYALLSPVSVPKNESIITIYKNHSDSSLDFLQKLINASGGDHPSLPTPSQVVALDLETRGTNPLDPNNYIVGIGLHFHGNSIYINLKDEPLAEEVKENTFKILREAKTPLIAHNLFYEGIWTRQYGLNWVSCTYALFRFLASEGFIGQSWGLKDAQVDLLGWDSKGDVELSEWLIDTGWITNRSYKLRGGETEERIREVQDKIKLAQEEGKELRANKAEMWRAPIDILGKYCALDAQSTCALYKYIFYPILMQDSCLALRDFYPYFNRHILRHCEQFHTGINLDREALTEYNKTLIKTIEEKTREFLELPEISSYLVKWNAEREKEHLAKQPKKYLKRKIPKEPAIKFKKNGELSKSWTNWQAKMEELESTPPTINKNWQKWKEGELPKFNIDSPKDLAWLIYEEMQFPVVIETDKGRPALNDKALLGFGKIGKYLANRVALVKEQGYISAYLEKSELTGRLHPQFRLPGTLTGRLAGAGGVNLQQVPKSKECLEAWIPSPGKVFVDCDVSALEAVVLAELSRDPTLWKLYGPDATPGQDVYLFNGSNIPILKDPILAAGYDPDSTTSEMVSRVKKICKTWRAVAKKVTLGANYGIGPKKLQQDLELEGIKLNKGQVYKIWEGFWNLYGGIKKYEGKLLDQYNRLGYIINGIGRPIGIWEEKLKDVVNRQCFHGDTLIRVKDKGWKPIRELDNGDLVWDNKEWVPCMGSRIMKQSTCIELFGTYLTKDHKILDEKEEWKEAQSFKRQYRQVEEGKHSAESVRPRAVMLPDYSWSDVWQLASTVLRTKARRWNTLGTMLLSSQFKWSLRKIYQSTREKN